MEASWVEGCTRFSSIMVPPRAKKWSRKRFTRLRILRADIPRGGAFASDVINGFLFKRAAAAANSEVKFPGRLDNKDAERLEDGVVERRDARSEPGNEEGGDCADGENGVCTNEVGEAKVGGRLVLEVGGVAVSGIAVNVLSGSCMVTIGAEISPGKPRR